MQSPCTGFQPVLDSQKCGPRPHNVFCRLKSSYEACHIAISNCLSGLMMILKRAFYEVECFRGNWSVRERRRQTNSLYFERSGLSENKKKLAKLAQSGTEQTEPELAVRDPYIFEFLGIKPFGITILAFGFLGYTWASLQAPARHLSQGRCMLIATNFDTH